MTHRVTLSIVSFILILCPFSSYAEVIYEQPDYSVTSGNPAGGDTYLQAIGTSLSGSVSSVTFRIQTESANPGLGNYFAKVRECTSSNPSGTCNTYASIEIAPTYDGSTSLFVFSFASPVTLDSAKYYFINVAHGASWPGQSIVNGGGTAGRMYGSASPYGSNVCGHASIGDTCDGLSSIYFVIDDGFFNTTTRINTVDPYDGETIASSSTETFGATGYISPDVYEDGTFIEMKFAPYSAYQSAVASPEFLYTTIELPVNAAGAFSVSTTSPVGVNGLYDLETQIKTNSLTNDFLNFIGFGQFANNGVLSATSTQFTVNYLIGYDIFIASTTESIETYLASSTVSMASCSSWTSFDLMDCLNLLFVPQTAPIYAALSSFKNNFLSYMPWGYVTRTLYIFTSSATTTLPLLPLSLPDLDGVRHVVITLDPEDIVRGSVAVTAQIADPVSGLSIQDMFQPWYRLMLALGILFTIVFDIGGVVKHGREHKL